MIKHLLTIFLTAVGLQAASPHLTLQFETNGNVVFPANGTGKWTNDVLEAQGKLGGKVYGAGTTTPMELTNIVTAHYKDVAMFGLNGDGTTDWTTTLNNAITTNVNAGEIIAFLGTGTNKLDGVVFNKRIGGIYIAPGHTILWASPTTNLFQFNVSQHIKIWGGGRILATGIGTNNVANFHSAISLLGTGGAATLDSFTVDGIVFEGMAKGGIYNGASRGVNLVVRNCISLNQYQLPTTAPWANAFVWMSSAVADTYNSLTFADNILSNAPTSSSRLPGGAFIAASDAVNSYTTHNTYGNRLYRVGGDNVIGSAHYGVGAFDYYEDTINSYTGFNMITNSEYVGIKDQSSFNSVVAHNSVHTTYSMAIDISVGERVQTNAYANHLVLGNRIWGNGSSTYGINIRPGDSGNAVPNVIAAYNFMTNVYRGINLAGANVSGPVAKYGPVKLLHNIIYSTNNNGIMMYDVLNAEIDVIGNTVVTEGSGSAFSAITTNQTSNIRLVGNTFKGPSWAARVWGVNSLIVDNNSFEGTGAEATEFKQDAAGNLIGNLTWTRSNRTISGTNDHVFADFTVVNIEREDGKNYYKRSSTADYQILAADGNALFTVDTANSSIGIGPQGTTTAGIPLRIRYDTNAFLHGINVGNFGTTNAAVSVTLGVNGGSANFYATDETYGTTPYRSNRAGILVNSLEGTIFEVPVGGDHEFYETSTLLGGFSASGLKLREQAAPSTPPSGFGYIYVWTNGLPYLINDSAQTYLLAGVNWVGLAAGDLTTTMTNATTKAYWIAPENGTLLSVDGSVLTVSSAEGIQMDLNINGSSALTTKLYIDAGERSSLTSATNAVIGTTTFSAGDLLTVDLDAVGTGAAGPQLKFKWTPR
jgi:hypothetical protein